MNIESGESIVLRPGHGGKGFLRRIFGFLPGPCRLARAIAGGHRPIYNVFIMPRRDYYDILGVAPSATPEQIKAAYRRLARANHPDVSKAPDATEKFKEATAAYEVLSDPHKRKTYDQFGHAGPGPFGAGPAGGRVRSWAGRGGKRPVGMPFDFEDLFSSSPFSGMSLKDLLSALGGGGAGRRRSPPRRGPDAELPITLDFLQAARGTVTTIQLRGLDGSAQQIDVKIPPGVNEGSKIRIRGKGNPGSAGPGDLYLITHVRQHPYFRRDGADIYLDLPVSVLEAAAGATVSVPTLDGPAELKIPPGASGGTRLRMRGKGLAHPKTATRGDQYVVLKIVLPKSLSKRGRQLLQEFAQTDPVNPREKVHW